MTQGHKLLASPVTLADDDLVPVTDVRDRGDQIAPDFLATRDVDQRDVDSEENQHHVEGG